MEENSWMAHYFFSKRIDYFLLKIKGISLFQQHLMIMNRHGSHITLEACKKGKDIGIDLLSLLPYTFYGLQLLNLVIFKPFKTTFRVYKDI